MKTILIITLLSFCSLNSSAQEEQKNSLSTSLIRFEKNSQTLRYDFKIKYVTSVEYQRFFNKWSFGVEYEHGLNRIDESSSINYEYFYGTGFLREDNIYVTANYSIFNLFESRLKINTGLGVYFSSLNFSGNFRGGNTISSTPHNSTHNTYGLTPSLSIMYYLTSRLFMSINTSWRFGASKVYDNINDKRSYYGEHVVTAPELKIGLNF